MSISEYEVGEVSIPIRRRGQFLKQARRKMDQDEPLTEREIAELLATDEVSPDELQPYVQSNPEYEGDRYTRRIQSV